MAYTTIPTKADGEILSASHLNTIGDNQEFLYGILQQANIPFNGVRATVEDFNQSNGVWSLRHRHRYLHYRMLAESGNSPTFVRILYGGIRVLNRTDVAFSFTGSVDLEDPATWPGFLGAPLAGVWTTATGYSSTDDGGDIVSHGGAYYWCTGSHTSGATTEPGVGASWTTVWQLITFVVGTIYQTYMVVNFNDPGNQMTVEYIFEGSEASL